MPHCSASEFGPNHFKVIREAMLRDGLTRQGINSRMKRITRMFKWAASEGKDSGVGVRDTTAYSGPEGWSDCRA